MVVSGLTLQRRLKGCMERCAPHMLGPRWFQHWAWGGTLRARGGGFTGTQHVCRVQALAWKKEFSTSDKASSEALIVTTSLPGRLLVPCPPCACLFSDSAATATTSG